MKDELSKEICVQASGLLCLLRWLQAKHSTLFENKPRARYCTCGVINRALDTKFDQCNPLIKRAKSGQ